MSTIVRRTISVFACALVAASFAAVSGAPTPVVEYVDRSSETGLDYDGQPRNATVIDYNGNGYKDLLITRYTYRAMIWKGTGYTINGAPQFEDETSSVFPSQSAPAAGTTGILTADYDNDGHVDFIAPNPSSGTVLYRNNGGSTFVDATSSSGLDEIASSWDLAYGHTAAWADYDQDGYVDLTLISGYPESGEGSLLIAHNQAGAFDDDATPAADIVGNSPLWADFDGDGMLDLMILQTVANPVQTPPPPDYFHYLFINQGDGTFVDEAWDRIGDFDRLDSGKIAAAADMDNDGDLDVVYAHHDEIGYLENDGDGDFTDRDMASFNDNDLPTDLVLLDFDLDGFQDVLLGKGDIYFSNPLATDTYLFANVDGGGGTRDLVNVASQAGLSDNAFFAGITAADYNRDGFTDLYLTREDDEEFFYKAKPTSGQSQKHWLGVRLESLHGANNTLGLGARVTVVTGTPTIHTWIVDGGGSGLASQHEPELVFGLGSYASTVTVTVQWPNGRAQTVSTVSTDQYVTITDDSPVVDASTLDFNTVYHVQTGEQDWVFTWETWNDSYGPLDKVIFDLVATDDDCDPSVGVLTSQTQGVSHSKTSLGGGKYEHTLTWADVTCVPRCYVYYNVESATADYTNASEVTSFRVQSCLQSP